MVNNLYLGLVDHLLALFINRDRQAKRDAAAATYTPPITRQHAEWPHQAWPYRPWPGGDGR